MQWLISRITALIQTHADLNL